MVKSWQVRALGVVALAVMVGGGAFANPGPGPGPRPGPGGPGPGPGPTPPSTLDWVDQGGARSLPSVLGNLAPHAEGPFYTPYPFQTLLGATYRPGPLTPAPGLAPRTRYLLGLPDGSYLSIGDQGALEATRNLVTLQDSLVKIVEAVPEASDPTLFRFDSELHALFSLDADPAQGQLLVFRNNWGTAQSPLGRGYLTFRWDPATRGLRVYGRQLYNLSNNTHAPDPAFRSTGWYLRWESGRATLVPGAAQATPVTLVLSPLNVAMPADFNPEGIPYQPNARVPISNFVRNSTDDIEGERSKVQQNLADAYRAQVAAPGDDPGTRAAAEAALAAIQKSLEAEGAHLRYPAALYLAYRRGSLGTTLQSDDIANGHLGMHAVPYAYFTNAADPAGVHHPFLVLASYAVADKPNRLLDVSRPPGDGGDGRGGYAEQTVTRDATLQLYLTKIPLRDYGLVGSWAENKMPATLKTDAHFNGPDTVYNDASTSAIGVAVDGVVIYPVLNNTLATAQESAEVTSTGIHVGQGMGLHYHADGHTALGVDLTLYNLVDYAGQTHPPLIGFGLDGVALYGAYEASVPDLEGAQVPLDAFGGHSHGAFGYHYHAHLVAAKTASGKPYTLHVLLKGPWKGRINEIPEFWDPRKGEPAYSLGQQSRYVGKR